MSNRSGELISNLSGELEYKSFKPSNLPPNPPIVLDGEMVEFLINANKQIAVLEAISGRIPNIDLFVSMYVRKEALLSSQIEGTQCTLDDVLNPLIMENANREVSDVVNYIKATEYAVERLKTMPLCNRFIKEIHQVLLSDVRGQEKNPGEFRTSQNWIGGSGSILKNARYIPPNIDDMTVSLSELESFINDDNDINPLISAALIHYQFETIHPFLDGNGRVGRLLITLYLMEKRILSTPALYISYFLKKNRIEYYDRMTEVRRTGNYEQWVKFFLLAFYEAATDAIETIDKLESLHEINIKKLNDLGRTKINAEKVFSYIEANPIIEIKKTAEALGVAYNTVSKIVDIFIERNILTKNEKVRNTQIYSYEEYLDILRKDTV